MVALQGHSLDLLCAPVIRVCRARQLCLVKPCLWLRLPLSPCCPLPPLRAKLQNCQLLGADLPELPRHWLSMPIYAHSPIRWPGPCLPTAQRSQAVKHRALGQCPSVFGLVGRCASLAPALKPFGPTKNGASKTPLH